MCGGNRPSVWRGTSPELRQQMNALRGEGESAECLPFFRKPASDLEKHSTTMEEVESRPSASASGIKPFKRSSFRAWVEPPVIRDSNAGLKELPTAEDVSVDMLVSSAPLGRKITSSSWWLTKLLQPIDEPAASIVAVAEPRKSLVQDSSQGKADMDIGADGDHPMVVWPEQPQQAQLHNAKRPKPSPASTTLVTPVPDAPAPTADAARISDRLMALADAAHHNSADGSEQTDWQLAQQASGSGEAANGTGRCNCGCGTNSPPDSAKAPQQNPACSIPYPSSTASASSEGAAASGSQAAPRAAGPEPRTATTTALSTDAATAAAPPPAPQQERKRGALEAQATQAAPAERVRAPLRGRAALEAAAEASGEVDDGAVVLVAKALTKSDANTRRIILPRISVETNMPQVASWGYWPVNVVDSSGRSWDFVMRAWSNGHNPKPVYVLEHISDFVREYSVQEGDVMGVCKTPDGRFTVELNTPRLKAALIHNPGLGGTTPAAHRTQAVARGPRVLSGPAPDSPNDIAGDFGPAPSAPQHRACARTFGCTKPGGHAGWCVGHRGFKRKSQPAPSSNSNRPASTSLNGAPMRKPLVPPPLQGFAGMAPGHAQGQQQQQFQGQQHTALMLDQQHATMALPPAPHGMGAELYHTLLLQAQAQAQAQVAAAGAALAESSRQGLMQWQAMPQQQQVQVPEGQGAAGGASAMGGGWFMAAPGMNVAPMQL